MATETSSNSWHLVGRLADEVQEHCLRIAPLPFRVGRSDDASLQLDLAGVSAEHAEIFVLDGDLWIRDLDSTNGTFVNGREVNGAVSLKPGDVLHFADLPFLLKEVEPRGVADEPRAADQRMGHILAATDEWMATVDALPQLILLLDSDGRVRRSNRTLERWQLGDVRGVSGRHVHGVLHPSCTDDDCELSRAWHDALEQLIERSEEAAPFERELFDPVLARHLLVRVHSTQHRTDGQQAFTLSIEDISERKEAEHAPVASQAFSGRQRLY